MKSNRVFWVTLALVLLVAGTAMAAPPSETFGKAAEELDSWRRDTSWAIFAGILWCGTAFVMLIARQWKLLSSMVLIPLAVLMLYQGGTYFAKFATTQSTPMSSSVGTGP